MLIQSFLETSALSTPCFTASVGYGIDDPRDAELWILLSSAHLRDENVTAAEQHARKAIALSSSEPFIHQQAWLQLADVLDAKGEANEARSIRRRYRNALG